MLKDPHMPTIIEQIYGVKYLILCLLNLLFKIYKLNILFFMGG